MNIDDMITPYDATMEDPATSYLKYLYASMQYYIVPVTKYEFYMYGEEGADGADAGPPKENKEPPRSIIDDVSYIARRLKEIQAEKDGATPPILPLQDSPSA